MGVIVNQCRPVEVTNDLKTPPDSVKGLHCIGRDLHLNAARHSHGYGPGDNYTINFAPANLTITTKTLTVTADRGVKDFTFDQVFDQASKQEAVFEDTKMLVESCLDGYNVCLFAYGQTGSGKTFTMTGSPALPGLTPRAIDEIFRLKDERSAVQITVKTYFVELYLDAIVDLYFILDNKGKKGADPPKLDIKLDNKNAWACMQNSKE